MTDHSLSVLRRVAIREFTCDRCASEPTFRCTENGAEVAVHDERLDAARIWFTGYDFAVREGGLRTQIVQLKADLRASALEVNGLSDQVATLERNLAATEAEFEAYKRSHPDVPAPGKTATRFGACPQKGGTTLAAAQTVIAKWGKGAAVRQFLATGVAPRPADAGIVHISWKPTLAQITDSWVRSVCANLQAGDCVEVWHEADKKVTDGKLTYDDVVARKNAFYVAVKRVRPDLLVVNTLTGWLLDPKSGKDVERWAAVRADVLGVDCDGVRPTKLPYTDYTGESQRALKFLADHPSYRWFSVPEFGCPRIPSADPDGAIRAAYHDQYAGLWAATGKCLYVTAYEYNSSPFYSLDLPAEVAGWKAHVA